MLLPEQAGLQSRLHDVERARYNGATHSAKSRLAYSCQFVPNKGVTSEHNAYPPATKCCHDFAGSQLLFEGPATGCDVVSAIVCLDDVEGLSEATERRGPASACQRGGGEDREPRKQGQRNCSQSGRVRRAERRSSNRQHTWQIR